jgi:glycosyltransferase involved in cell wall biosynthesis
MDEKISIIIPAHNEEKVIAATLKPLVEAASNSFLEIIVICNGCTDKTAEVVASFGSAIKCIETPTPSKANALNLGDSEAHYFPRFYQDADIVLSFETICQVAQVLQSGKYLAASPTIHMDLRNSSWAVRSYYEIWLQLPYIKEGMIGAGVYALSKEGRKRFGKFPLIIADDGYIRALFNAKERTSVASCYSLVRAPDDMESLLKIKTRSRLGGYEFKSKFPELLKNEEKNYRSALFGLLKRIQTWPKILIYLYVNLSSRLRANKYAQIQGYTGWDRDESSRKNTKE